MCTARDSNSLAALSAIVAYVLLLFEELASLTDYRFKAVASGLCAYHCYVRPPPPPGAKSGI